METSSVTFLLFTAFSGLRIFSYLPQIRRVARDANGASAISYSTWALWTGANIATALYALTNLGDMYLAFVSTMYAGCCMTVIALTMLKRRGLERRCPNFASRSTWSVAVTPKILNLHDTDCFTALHPADEPPSVCGGRPIGPGANRLDILVMKSSSPPNARGTQEMLH